MDGDPLAAGQKIPGITSVAVPGISAGDRPAYPEFRRLSAASRHSWEGVSEVRPYKPNFSTAGGKTADPPLRTERMDDTKIGAQIVAGIHIGTRERRAVH